MRSTPTGSAVIDCIFTTIGVVLLLVSIRITCEAIVFIFNIADDLKTVRRQGISIKGRGRMAARNATICYISRRRGRPPWTCFWLERMTETAEAVDVHGTAVTRWRLHHPAFQAKLRNRRRELYVGAAACGSIRTNPDRKLPRRMHFLQTHVISMISAVRIQSAMTCAKVHRARWVGSA